MLFSSRANADHGKRRTNDDKRKAVNRLLTDSEWCNWSDGKIAKHCKVSQPFVTKVRHELRTNNGYEFTTLRQKADGGFIETENIGKSSSDPERHSPADPKKESIPFVMKVDKKRLPPKEKGTGKKQKSGAGDEGDYYKLNSTQNLSAKIADTKKLISDLQDCLRAFDGFLVIEGKTQKLKKEDLQDQWEKIKPLWSKFAVYVEKNFDWIS
jgi:hypothetical protein